MIAIDTNILVYARRQETTHHKAALTLLKSLATGEAPWAIPWPCVYEYLRVVTHPRVFAPPTDVDLALADFDGLAASPSLHLLGEGPSHLAQLRQAVRSGGVTGNLVHDAHIAALVVEHGVRELLTTDRDFARFPGVRARNPFARWEVHETPVAARKSRARRSTPAV